MIFRLNLKSCLLALAGSAVLAFGIYNIHSLSELTEGGILGLTLLIEHWYGLSPAISGFILNILCYAVGWRFLGNNFIGYSIFAGGGFSLFYAIFEMFPPLFPEVSQYPLTAAILGALFVGIGCGVSICAGGAPTGDDALAMSISKIFKFNIRWAYLISDLTVLSLSLFYIPSEKLLYSLITVFISGQIIGFIQKLFSNDDLSLQPEPDWNMRDVLVGTLRNTMQLETCLKNNFYHIPSVRLYSGDFPIKYIAIYQSLHKFGEAAGIYYYGEISDISLVKRSEILEIPKLSDELYYRFEIKEWKKLDSPVLPSEADFINLSTTLFLLHNSRETSELSLRTQDEFLLYRDIRRLLRGEIAVLHPKNSDIRINLQGDNIILSSHGKTVFSCQRSDYENKRIQIFRYIYSLTVK